MTTLKDISAELGLSVATVSRALNGFPEVNTRTRRQVEEAAKRLNYRPNRLAQKLQSGRSGMVGMIVRPDPKSPADRSFVEIMMGLSQELSVHDIDMVFQVAVDSDPIFPYRRLVEKNTVDGFILNAPRVDDPRFAFLKSRGIPFVVHGRGGAEPDYPYFDIDNAQVGAASVDLLADLGHARIALLNGPGHWAYAAQRRAGVASALTTRDIHVPAHFLLDDDRDPNFSYRAALGMLSGRFGPRPTAIICASTVFAAGVYRAAADLSLDIPTDLSVIAHDDAVPELRAINFEPALTVTRAPLRDACGPLAACLIGALDGAPVETLQKTALADLIIRQSTGSVPKQEKTPWT